MSSCPPDPLFSRMALLLRFEMPNCPTQLAIFGPQLLFAPADTIRYELAFAIKAAFTAAGSTAITLRAALVSFMVLSATVKMTTPAMVNSHTRLACAGAAARPRTAAHAAARAWVLERFFIAFMVASPGLP